VRSPSAITRWVVVVGFQPRHRGRLARGAGAASLADPSQRHPRSVDRRWLGSGLFLCGVCDEGTTIRSASTTGGASGSKRPTYRCKAGAHLARVAEPVDELITTLVIKRLSRPDARLLLTADNGEDVGALGSEAAVLQVRLDEVAALFADGAVTGRQLAEATAKLRAKFTDVELRPATATAGSPLVGFANAEDIAEAWEVASVRGRKIVVDALMVVTLLPAPRGRRSGGHYFSPESVRIDWKG
jgi:site-specific DNA recombinase